MAPFFCSALKQNKTTGAQDVVEPARRQIAGARRSSNQLAGPVKWA